ncbi:MAG: type VI secretion system baseplate subunit TssE [Gemmatimonadota bacterium]|nr:type VI secretion system baseplate subunit TssE [Gemmatimonadota bacterium]
MAKTELEQTVQQSLIDRLADDEPSSSAEPPMNRAQSVRELKASLRRDLEWLLNTRRTNVPLPDGTFEVERSLIRYGLPDITSMSKDDAAEHVRLLRGVEEAIVRFEPRLANVRIALVPGPEGRRRELHFLIDAMLRMDPSPEHIVFDTALELGTGEVQVKGEGSAG